jgi:hypothetical protein
VQNETQTVRTPNHFVRAEAERIAKQDPTKFVLEFAAEDLSREWEAGFLKSKESERDGAKGSPRCLQVTVTDPGSIKRLLDALMRSSRLGSSPRDPIDGLPTSAVDYLRFYSSDRQVGRFHFRAERLDYSWGEEVVGIIVPIYERATAKYMPKNQRE